VEFIIYFGIIKILCLFFLNIKLTSAFLLVFLLIKFNDFRLKITFVIFYDFSEVLNSSIIKAFLESSV